MPQCDVRIAYSSVVYKLIWYKINDFCQIEMASNLSETTSGNLHIRIVIFSATYCLKHILSACQSRSIN